MADEVFIGNGVSELIDLALRALLNEGDEVLVPSPDYPLGLRRRTLNGGRVVHYPCLPENKFVPDPEDIEQLVTKKTRDRRHQLRITRLARCTRARCSKGSRVSRNVISLVVFADEIYDQMTYEGTSTFPWLRW